MNTPSRASQTQCLPDFVGGGEIRSPDDHRLEVHVDVAVVDAVRVAVAALAADERVVAVGLGLAAVALVALHT